ncbi:MAG TPA: pseudouridine synthase [Spongiibacteraceae bacterium]
MAETALLNLYPSTFILPRGNWPTVLECLCAKFPTIARERWCDRFARGLVLDADKLPLDATHIYREGLRVHYFREVPDEKPIPFIESVLHVDDHLIVVDKPHFLPVMPAGEYVEQTLLRRLQRRFKNPELTPLHRIDRHTAGLVLFSVQRARRSAYQTLFREHKMFKRYEAIAPALPHQQFPLLRASCIIAGEPFFCSQEVAGIPNAETRIDVLDRRDDLWRYALYPISGKKHQLRLHMAALGAPICNDPFYPAARAEADDDYAHPLKLLACELRFIDPISGIERHFETQLTLNW